MAVGYLLDENVDTAYRDQLARRGTLAIMVVGEAGVPAKGTADPVILLWCEQHDFLLVTNNRRTMPRHLADRMAAGQHVPGIIILDPDGSLGSNLNELALIADALLPDELRDQILYLPLR